MCVCQHRGDGGGRCTGHVEVGVRGGVEGGSYLGQAQLRGMRWQEGAPSWGLCFLKGLLTHNRLSSKIILERLVQCQTEAAEIYD